MGIIVTPLDNNKLRLKIREPYRTLHIWDINKNGIAYKIFEDKLKVMVDCGEI